MSCPRCNTEMMTTHVGNICGDCGYIDSSPEKHAEITPHSSLVHSEHRLADPTEPGTGQVDDLVSVTAFTAESNTTLGAFTWIQVTVSRFSYYAVVFVLVVILGGISYNLFSRIHAERAATMCDKNLSHSSAGPAEAGVSPRPTPNCK